MPYNFYLGIDVSKASLSVVLMNSDSKVLWSSKKIANQPSGFKQMVSNRWLNTHQRLLQNMQTGMTIL